MIFSLRPKKIIGYIMLMSLSLCVSSLDHKNSEIAQVLHRPIRALTFPETSNTGIFFALAVPLEAPRNSVAMSYFFEASYALPPNTTISEPWTERKNRKKRAIDRRTIYKTMINKFESSGLPGRGCLLRSICETSEYPLHYNGVLGDIVHVVFTPSTSRDEDLPHDIVKAELVGRANNCSKYHANCPVGLFDLIGILA